MLVAETGCRGWEPDAPEMTQQFIDIGVNLTGKAFAGDAAAVIQRGQEVGVCAMIVTGTSVEQSRQALELVDRWPQYLKATAGVHPHDADGFNSAGLDELRTMCASPHTVAVGECGLDFNRNYSAPSRQRTAFEAQLQLACEMKLPVFLHQRDAHREFSAMLRAYATDLSGAVVHCFTGTPDQALEYVELGMYVGITGWICDERRGRDLQQAVRVLPLQRVLLETDAPYLIPRDLQSMPVVRRRNEPCFLPHICAVTARYMQVETAELARAALENSRRVFALAD